MNQSNVSRIPQSKKSKVEIKIMINIFKNIISISFFQIAENSSRNFKITWLQNNLTVIQVVAQILETFNWNINSF